MPNAADWLESTCDDCVLSLYIQPGAKRTAVLGVFGQRLKIAVQAPPVEGKANEALVRWLAKTLGLKKHEVVIVAGQNSRHKRVVVHNAAAVDVLATLTPTS